MLLVISLRFGVCFICFWFFGHLENFLFIGPAIIFVKSFQIVSFTLQNGHKV